MKIQLVLYGRTEADAKWLFMEKDKVSLVMDSDGLDIWVEKMEQYMDLKMTARMPFEKSQLDDVGTGSCSIHVMESFKESETMLKFVRQMWLYADVSPSDLNLNLSVLQWSLIPESDSEALLISSKQVIGRKELARLANSHEDLSLNQIFENASETPNQHRIVNLYFLAKKLMGMECYREAWLLIQHMSDMVREEKLFMCIENILDEVESPVNGHHKHLMKMFRQYQFFPTARILMVIVSRKGGPDGQHSQNIPAEDNLLYAMVMVMLDSFNLYLARE